MAYPRNRRRRTAFISRQVFVLLIIAALVLPVLLHRSGSFIPPSQAVSPNIVISQIYGGGGNAGSTYRQDFIELFNRGTSSQSLNGWSVQYASATGTSWQKTDLTNVTLLPGQYYLVRQAQGTGGTTDIPTADVTGAPVIAMSATAGKVALLNTTAFIANGTSCPSGVTVVDIAGFGTTANCFEGTGPTPAPSNTNAVQRAANGCTDTDQNASDFSAGLPTPRNTASTFSPCSPPVPNLTITDVTANETNAGTTTFNFQVNLSAPAGAGGVTFDIATADGTAQDDNPAVSEDDDYVGQSLTGQTIAAGNASFAFNVTVNGDAVVEPTENFFVNVTNVSGANLTDGQGQGTITNDDSPNLSIDDVTQNEGSGGGITSFTFTVSLSTTTHTGVTFDIATSDGTAQDGNPGGEDTDYTAGILIGQTIPNGSDTYQFTVDVNADSTVEPNETFFVDVTNVVGASVTDGQGLGTITNDDVLLTFISQVQGNGASSPIVGSSVTVRGIVTLLKSNGFFIQEEVSDYDGDPNTSEGVFVFTSSAPTVAVADQATVTATVVEFNTLTELSSPSVSVNSTGNVLPTAVTLDSVILDPAAPADQSNLEKYEGMRFSAASLISVSPNDNFFDIETVLPAVPRQQVFREPGIPSGNTVPPDPTSGLVDPNIPIWDRNPERLSLDTNGRAGTTGVAYTSNVTFSDVAGPLDFSFGRYRLIPEAGFTASSNISASPAPTPTGDEFTVVGYNIENFNNSATQRQKAADTIRNFLHYPDIIGVVEIFNVAALEALAAEINNDAVAASDPNPLYEARLIPTPVAGITQNVGFLVKTARVTIDAVTQERTASTYVRPSDSATDDTHDRPPLVLRATVDPSGANPRPVIVVVNHTRSFISIELVAGAGLDVRAKRKAQAEDLAGLLQELQTNNPGVPVISVGDYNAFQFNNGYDDPISVLKGNPTTDDKIVVDQSLDVVNPDFFNLVEDVPAAERYSFFFDDDGAMQVLDHVLVNTAARARNTRIHIAHVNSDFPAAPSSAFATDAARVERNSDHDPVMAYFTLNQQQTAGSVIISEFRFRGPGGVVPVTATVKGRAAPELIGPTNQAQDEFIEIYNNSNSDITVSTTDGSAGWAVVAADGVTRFIIPNNTIIPARGHFLGVNTLGYSLANYGGFGAAAGNSILLADGVTPAPGYTQDIPDGSGIALFRSANAANFTLAERLDAAGYAGVDPLYREGTGFPTGGAETTGGLEHTFFRTMTRTSSGIPKDTGDNTADFFLADTAGTDFDPGAGTTQRLGAPGPENLSSPINRTAQFGYALLDTGVSAESIPNRERNPSVVPGDFGTLTLRRTFTNNTGATLNRLRFRIVEITTFPSPTGSGLADLRALTSSDDTVCVGGGTLPLCTGGTSVVVRGTTLEQPPTQSIGGGWNASLNVPLSSPASVEAAAAKVSYDTPTTGTIVLSAPLNNGEAINVQFKLGVWQTGRYFFYLNIEATPGLVLIP